MDHPAYPADQPEDAKPCCSYEASSNSKMKAKRHKLAQAYKHFTAEDWLKVMYWDELTFQCIRASRAKAQRPESTSRYDSKYTMKTVRHSDSVMVWGCFSGFAGHVGLYYLSKIQP
jgi:hypothetical protein